MYVLYSQQNQYISNRSELGLQEYIDPWLGIVPVFYLLAVVD